MGIESKARHLTNATPRQVAARCAFGQPMPQARVNLIVKRKRDGQRVCVRRDVPSGQIGATSRTLRALFGDADYLVRVELLGWDNGGDAA